jgi:hypothetical protein
MAKRKFDESSVNRDESGRFASAKGIGKQHDLKSVMAEQAGKVRNNRLPTKPSLPKSKGVKNDRLPTKPSLPKQKGVRNDRLPTRPSLPTNRLRSTSSSRRTSGGLTTNSLKSTSSLRRTGSQR